MNLGYTITFAVLFIEGIISLALLSFILFIILKHKKDRAPLTVFFLDKNLTAKELNLFIYPAIFLFLTGLLTFIQELLKSYSRLVSIDTLLFFLAYVFSIMALLVIIYILSRWSKRFMRFV